MRFLLSILVLTGLLGCVSTRITSFRDPNYSGPRVSKILVFANYASMETRVEFEHEFAIALVENGVWADGAYVYFPPFRDYTDSEIVATSDRNSIDGWLIIKPGGSSYVSIHDYGNSESRKVVGTEELNSMGTQIALFNANGAIPLYRAETQTQLYRYNGNTFSTFNDVVLSAAVNVADDLRADRLVRATMK